MKQALIAILSFSFAAAAMAAGKPCEELKAEIAAKLEAKGVKGYDITIVENDKVGEAKVIGSCEGGSKKLTYSKQ